jgi:hypothetical protein
MAPGHRSFHTDHCPRCECGYGPIDNGGCPLTERRHEARRQVGCNLTDICTRGGDLETSGVEHGCAMALESAHGYVVIDALVGYKHDDGAKGTDTGLVKSSKKSKANRVEE